MVMCRPISNEGTTNLMLNYNRRGAHGVGLEDALEMVQPVYFDVEFVVDVSFVKQQ